MPLFVPPPGEGDPSKPMVDWINNAPPADLAAELMGLFGSGGPAREVVFWTDFSNWMFRQYPPRKGVLVMGPPVDRSIREAVQLLEHSELVVRYGSEHEAWRVTRLGLATLATGKEAVRQRIKDRTGM
jgi:hypothetical protein